MTKAGDELAHVREIEQLSRSATRVLRSGEETLDQEARDIGAKAASRMDAHEVLCTERWNQLRKSVDELAQKLNRTVGYVPASLIAALMGICGYLADRAFPLH